MAHRCFLLLFMAPTKAGVPAPITIFDAGAASSVGDAASFSLGESAGAFVLSPLERRDVVRKPMGDWS